MFNMEEDNEKYGDQPGAKASAVSAQLDYKSIQNIIKSSSQLPLLTFKFPELTKQMHSVHGMVFKNKNR